MPSDISKKSKKCFTKKLQKGINIFLSKRNKSENMVASNIKISQKMKNKGLVSIEKYVKYRKTKCFTNKEWLIFFGWEPYAIFFLDKYIKSFLWDFWFWQKWKHLKIGYKKLFRIIYFGKCNKILHFLTSCSRISVFNRI